MTKQEILEYFKDINAMYNECTRYDDLSRMLNELEETMVQNMTKEYIMQKALEVIAEQQAETKVNADRDNLLYLMGLNDGVIELTLKLQGKS